MKLMSKIWDALKAFYLEIFNVSKKPKFSEEQAWSLAEFDLYALDSNGTVMDSMLLSLEEDEDEEVYYVTFGQLIYFGHAQTRWFTGEAEIDVAMECLSYRAKFDPEDKTFFSEDSDVYGGEKVCLSDFDKAEEYLKAVFLECEVDEYMEEEGIEQEELLARLKEPYKTLFVTEHYQYSDRDAKQTEIVTAIAKNGQFCYIYCMVTSNNNRDNMGRFTAGHSGNAGGRPRDEHKVAELARSYTKEAIDTLVELMRHGKDDRVRGTAAQALLERGWGRSGYNTPKRL